MTEQQKIEWEKLKYFERNSLMWPDLLKWENTAHTVEIRRNSNSDGSIGLVSVNVQDSKTGNWYNVAKRVKEGYPAYGHVKPYDWITEVDGKATTDCTSDKFSKLISNGESVVNLSLKKAVDSLRKFVKKWGEEKTVILNLKEGNNFSEDCRLVHFYCKKDNSDPEDRILVWEMKPSGNMEISEPLDRGDELLEVNKEPVKDKKLANIYQLILCKVPAQVELKIKKMQHDIEITPESTAVQVAEPDKERFQEKGNPKQEDLVANNNERTEIIEGQENESEGTEKQPSRVQPADGSADNDNPTKCILVTKEMDENAGREGSESQTAVSSEVTTDLQEAKKVRRPSLKMMRRRLSSSSGFRRQHSRDEEQSNTATADCKKQENEAYNHSPETRRKNMCSSCSLKNEQPLSPDRNEWPIHKIETSYYEEICKLLDIKDRSSLSICAVLGCFPQTEAKAIEQQFKNGTGVANKALSIWGASNRANNVGALKKIFEEKRYDVFEEIEKWEKIPVCHGCGVKL